MTMSVLIEVIDEGPFNAGWLAYVLGLPLDETRSAVWIDGWRMGEETPSLRSIRDIFLKQTRLGHPQYRVTALPMRDVRTGVGSGGNPEHQLWPQERAVAQERERCLRIALEHARDDDWSCMCGWASPVAIGATTWRDHLAEEMAR